MDLPLDLKANFVTICIQISYLLHTFTSKLLLSLLPYHLCEGGWGMSAGRDGRGTLILGNFWRCCRFRPGTSDALKISGKRPTPLISGKLVSKLVRPGRSLRSRKLGSFLSPVAFEALSGGEGHNTFSLDWERRTIAGKAATLWCKSGNKAKLHSGDYYNYNLMH